MQQAVSSSYLDAFIENAENIIDDGQVQVENGQPEQSVVQQLKAIYQTIDLKKMSLLKKFER